MKKLTYLILGFILLFTFHMREALGIGIKDFQESNEPFEVLRPENLPGTKDVTGGAETTINEILQFAINLILYASGSVAVFFLVLGGIRYITSFGNQDMMDGAKKTIKYAVIGLLAVILAYAAVTNVIDLIYRATA
ncbi:hypothetical protein JW752_01930 [Candidatus Peregrinibacteria bacterium]|nr:hypothetical protein [Candidatus Peregrinibacteria bacterium]